MPDLPQAWRVGFDEVAELYDRVRPGYPDDLFDELAPHCRGRRPWSKSVLVQAKPRKASLPEAPE